MSASKRNEVSTGKMSVNESTTTMKTSATTIDPTYPVINVRGDRGGTEEYKTTDKVATASSTPIKGSSRTGSTSNGQTNDGKLFGHAGSTVMGDPTGRITATNRSTRGTKVSRMTRGTWIRRVTRIFSPVTTGTKSG